MTDNTSLADFIAEARLHASDMPPVIQRDYLNTALDKLAALTKPAVPDDYWDGSFPLRSSTPQSPRACCEAERERCAKIAEAEPELPGDPPPEFQQIAEQLRATVRVTKRNIATAIRGADQ